MSSVVVALPGVVQSSDRKAFFLNELAASFDRYVEDYGVEPDAFVAVMGGIKQTCRLSWTTQGESEGAPATMLALAYANVMKELAG